MSTFTNAHLHHTAEADGNGRPLFATSSAQLCSILERLKLITMIKNNSSVDLRLRPRQDTTQLGPCQERYVADSVARRIFKRSAHAPKGPHEETIFTAHRANMADSLKSGGSSFRDSIATSEVAAIKNLREQKWIKELQEGRLAFLRSMNSARHLERIPYLVLDERISSQLQDYADCISIFDALSMSSSVEDLGNTTVTPIPLQNAIRLISPPGLGGLACAELWCGGKYKRHSVERIKGREHAKDCACHLHVVWQHIVDPTRKYVGIGRGEDGRWIVELRREEKNKSTALQPTMTRLQPTASAVSWKSKSVFARKPVSLPPTVPPPSLPPGARDLTMAERPRRWDSLPGFNARPYLNTVVEDDCLTPATSILDLHPSSLSRTSSWETVLPTPRVSCIEPPRTVVTGNPRSTISRSSSWETLNTMRELSLQMLQEQEDGEAADICSPYQKIRRASVPASTSVKPLSVR